MGRYSSDPSVPLAFSEKWSVGVQLKIIVYFSCCYIALSLLPVGLMQTWASVEHGYWYARSPEFLQSGVIDTFRWLRVIGDTIFAAGSLALAVFVIGLRTGKSAGGERFRVGAAPAPTPTR